MLTRSSIWKALAASFLLSLLITIPLVCITHKGGPYSYAIYDRHGTLVGASTASDGQWRFAPSAVPANFEEAVITFEDKRFYVHFGVDIISIYRALLSDIRAGYIVSGGSTITMQTVRILGHNPKRTVAQKVKEALLAVLYELRYTKKGILELYAANAPFGGNVVGLEAASWRYFNRPPDSLTWAEAATLAVLPNQPSLVYPGANKDILRSKRDRLLRRLCSRGCFDSRTLQLSLDEPLPGRPYPLPSYAPHYLEFMKTRHPDETGIHTSLDSTLQKNTAQILERWSLQFSHSGINNAAAIIIDTATGSVLAYCGNTGRNGRNAATGDVDIIQSRRSSGSLLKPFLYAALLDSGMLLPDQLVRDMPTRIGSYKPDNNVPIYRGAVPASEALSRSLNIPAVLELREYGISAFLDYLKKCGFTTFDRTADDYGLPLILGGGEITLYEAARAYASLMDKANGSGTFPASTGAAYLTLAALEEGIRPADEALWESYANAKKIAWKTGTSSGNRDAWAIGTTCEYTVGVWTGNAEGQGSPELQSIRTTAPVMFDIFSTLPVTSWPDVPYDDLVLETVCAASGFKAGSSCAETKKILRPAAAPESRLCPYCTTVSLTPDGKYQASAQELTGQYAGQLPRVVKRFVLPPAVEYWYTRHSLGYHTLPPHLPFSSRSAQKELAIVFPEQNATICIPVEIDGTQGAMVMQAVNRSKDAVIYWDIDGEYLGCTKTIHEMTAHPSYGSHVLTITDSRGSRKVRTFKIISQEEQ
jgi:penicillin-binding protein 1C